MLSRNQQEIIENSLWVVNTALKRQGFQADEDLRQSAILYMCKCLERFDPDKNIKWSTYAYKNVYLFIMRNHAKQQLKQSSILNEDVSACKLPIESPLNNNESKYVLNSLKKVCTPEERLVIELKLQGYTVVEISSIIGCNIYRVNTLVQSIKNKARNFDNEKIKRRVLSMIKPHQIQEIKDKKNKGVLNSTLMKEYNLTYAELKVILEENWE